MEIFRPDSPINSEMADQFQRYGFARRISDVVSSGKYPTSLVVGIYGKWGEGKTSVLECIKQEIGNKAVVVNFNPWLFNEEKQLMKSFFSSISSALGQKLKTNKERAIEFIGDYADGLGSLINLAAPGFGGLLGFGKKISEKLKKDSIEDLKRKVDELIIETESNFVIFIDDIDRLDIQEVQAVFKLVKLVGDFPRTSYVLSFDHEMVAAALSPKYAGEARNSGHNFLEKIIQMPLHLPKASTHALRKFSLDLLDETLNNLSVNIESSERGEFISMFDKGFLPALTNPRLAVRYANSVGFSIPLLADEVSIIDLMIIEGFKVFYPSLYFFIRNNPEYFIGNLKSVSSYGEITKKDYNSIKDAINIQVQPYAQVKDQLLMMLLDLFPQLQAAYNNYFHTEVFYQKWHREKRICSPQYFERYFSYVVAKGDISDIHFKNILADIDKEDISILRQRFEAELPKLAPDLFIFKLNNFVSEFNKRQCAVLTSLLSPLGGLFSDKPLLFGVSLRDQLIRIIRELLDTLEKEQKRQISKDVLIHAQPFEFSVKLYLNLSMLPQRIEDAPFLDGAEMDQLRQIIFTRFREIVHRGNLFELSDHILWNMFDIFHNCGEVQEVNNYLLVELKKSQSNSLGIIKIFTPSSHSSSYSQPIKSSFTKKSYEAIRQFIDVKVLYEATISAFGHKQYLSPLVIREEALTDDNLLGIFQKMWEDEEDRNNKIDIVIGE